MGAMVMFSMNDGQFQLVYNVLSFSLASMMATTLFLWMRVPNIAPRYQTAVLISGLVTFIAAYHYIRIFNSWVEAYEYPSAGGRATIGENGAYPDPKLTGVPFNDAYRYMDWLLTVPLLLMEIILTMKMSPAESSAYCKQLGVASAAMIAVGYPGELVTVISWCTYPVVYLFPMFGIGGAQAVVAVQVGYCVSDIISKC